MAVVFGVHLGNTTACLALFKDGKVNVIANDSGDRVTPTIVSFTEKEKIVGLAAKTALARNLDSTVIHSKQLLNESMTDEEFERILRKRLCKIVKHGQVKKYEVKRGERIEHVTAEEVTTCIFTKLYQIANSSISSNSDMKLVLCVPLYFSQVSRQTLMKSAEDSGFDVLQVISEPSAAVLAHGIGVQDINEDCFCLVFRVGGISLDATIIHVSSGMYTVRESINVPHLGGDKFTNILADFFAKEFLQKWKLDPKESRRSMAKLTSASENCKHVLSTIGTAHCFVESLCEGVDFSYNITRARFENLISSEIQEYLKPAKDVIEKAALKFSDIKKVIPCGGSMKIPKLQQLLSELFPQAELLNGTSPDEVIAIGAARQGSYLSETFDPDCEHLSVEVSALSKPIFMKLSDKPDPVCILSALTPVPVRRVLSYHIESELPEISLQLYEMENEDSNVSRMLGELSLTDIIKTPTQLSIVVIVTSGKALHLTVSDKKTQSKANLKIEPSHS